MEELGTVVSNGSADKGDAALKTPLKPLPTAYGPWLFKAGLTPEQVEPVQACKWKVPCMQCASMPFGYA